MEKERHTLAGCCILSLLGGQKVVVPAQLSHVISLSPSSLLAQVSECQGVLRVSDWEPEADDVFRVTLKHVPVYYSPPES